MKISLETIWGRGGGESTTPPRCLHVIEYSSFVQMVESADVLVARLGIARDQRLHLDLIHSATLIHLHLDDPAWGEVMPGVEPGVG